MSATEKPTRASSSSTFGEVLTVNQLERLANHKYSASGVSLLEPILQPYWRWLVEQIPLWWAPNALTLAGLVINGLTTAILMIYCWDSRQPVSTNYDDGHDDSDDHDHDDEDGDGDIYFYTRKVSYDGTTDHLPMTRSLSEM